MVKILVKDFSDDAAMGWSTAAAEARHADDVYKKLCRLRLVARKQRKIIARQKEKIDK